jgi:hypothetical protein
MNFILTAMGTVKSVLWLGYGLDDRCSAPGRGKDFSESYPASFEIGT